MATKKNLNQEQKDLLLNALRGTLRKSEAKSEEVQQPPEQPNEDKLRIINEVFKQAMRNEKDKSAYVAPKRPFVDVRSVHVSKVRDKTEDVAFQLGQNAALFAQNMAELIALNVEELFYSQGRR